MDIKCFDFVKKTLSNVATTENEFRINKDLLLHICMGAMEAPIDPYRLCRHCLSDVDVFACYICMGAMQAPIDSYQLCRHRLSDVHVFVCYGEDFSSLRTFISTMIIAFYTVDEGELATRSYCK